MNMMHFRSQSFFKAILIPDSELHFCCTLTTVQRFFCEINRIGTDTENETILLRMFTKLNLIVSERIRVCFAITGQLNREFVSSSVNVVK